MDFSWVTWIFAESYADVNFLRTPHYSRLARGSKKKPIARVLLSVSAVGVLDVSKITDVKLNFEDLGARPGSAFQMVKCILDNAPELVTLEIAFGDMVYSPVGELISAKKVIKPWFPILAQAQRRRKSTKLTKVKFTRIPADWATRAVRWMSRRKIDVTLEVEVRPPPSWDW
ncbi:uncharacterized protein F4822DRAFT_434973 [Hypoxylon trugodes]|uniref:uncharacterized protein n=1 Tax=Hypoxylon trugodes TaxID=326681 RepID=UPI00219E35CD|nr:uncharacterized protein F4822DRAFT_434973 [Hypoxylon trugodes]KAI1383048.1 hypothetical protein F4822DRAFT_434973 [Hypoxylon trugodes]